MRVVAIAIVSWLAGLVAYRAALWLFWGQRVSSGDLRFVIFWSALATIVTTVTVFLPAMYHMAAWTSGRIADSWWAFVSAGTLLGVVPILLIVSLWSSKWRGALTSPEAALFYCMFCTFGAVFGAGFYLVYVRLKQPAAQ